MTVGHNCIFISPNYPEGHWRYAEALRAAGWQILGIGDAGEETFPPHLRNNIDDYYRVSDLHDYEQVARACAYMLWKHGPISRIESLNGYWDDLVCALRQDFVRVFTSPEPYFVRDTQAFATLPGSLRRTVSDAEQARSAAGELGLPLEVRRSDKKSGQYLVLSQDEDVEALEFSDGESYVLEPLSYPGGATALCRGGRVIAQSLYTIEEGTLIGQPMSVYQQQVFARCALATAGAGCAIVHVNAVVCSKGTRGKAKKGDLIPAGGKREPFHEYAVDLLCAEHGCDIRALWAGVQAEAPEREHLGCVVSRHSDLAYRRYHEEVLRRLAPRLWYHNSVMPRDRERYGDYIYVFTAGSAADARRDIKFITEPPAEK